MPRFKGESKNFKDQTDGKVKALNNALDRILADFLAQKGGRGPVSIEEERKIEEEIERHFKLRQAEALVSDMEARMMRGQKSPKDYSLNALLDKAANNYLLNQKYFPDR